MARLSKAVLADGKVVPLPGAATRQVDNYHYAEQRRAVKAARETNPFAGRYVPHRDRAALRLARELEGIKQTPALLLVSAILRTMDAESVTRVLEEIAPGAVTGSEPHTEAVATVKASRLCLGEHLDLLRAFEVLRERR